MSDKEDCRKLTENVKDLKDIMKEIVNLIDIQSQKIPETKIAQAQMLSDESNQILTELPSNKNSPILSGVMFGSIFGAISGLMVNSVLPFTLLGSGIGFFAGCISNKFIVL
tara:strand:- start:50 stop:382 length:333 start_codon:yes stop_codon:yes gene_type:complete